MLASWGMLSIVVTVLYGTKKVSDYRDLRRTETLGYCEDCHIYKAARLFARGEPVRSIEDRLAKSYEFDPMRIQETLALALPHRSDLDGGYQAFLKAVNQVIGEEVYG